MASTGEILTKLLRRWWVVALLAGLGAVAGYGFVRLADPTYIARAYVVAVARDPGNSTTAVSYAQAFARIVPQGDVVNAAAGASRGDASPAELRRQVQASTSPDAPVIEIAGSANTAEHAADLSNLMAAGLIGTANRHSADTRINLVLLSAADPPAEPASPRPVLDLAVGAAAGLLLGGLLVLAGSGRARTRPTPAKPIATGPTLPTNDAVVRPVANVTGRAPVPTGSQMDPYHQDYQDYQEPIGPRGGDG
jgi:capsular polysaccharide biosynthesis protein